ncbi:MAG: hypothetical protein ACK4QW_01700 [Alphaproteobacteria bacterium]
MTNGMRHGASAALLAAAVAIPALAWPGSAQAGLTVPDCDAIAAWAKAYDRNAKWQPNSLGTRYWFPALLAAPETAALFGKPAQDWTMDEIGTLREPLRACENDLRKQQRLHERNALSDLRSCIGNNVTAFLKGAEKARSDLAAATEALEREPASLPLLQFNASLARVARDQQAHAQANRAAGAVPGAGAASARALLAAVRDLPTAEIQTHVQPAAAARAEAMRATVRDALVAQIGATPATVPGLQTLARMAGTYRNEFGGALGPDDLTLVGRAIDARQTAAGGELAGIIVDEIGGMPEGEAAFAQLDQATDRRLLALLPTEAAGRVSAAADARRAALADLLFADLQKHLAGLPVAEEAIKEIDHRLLPRFAQWPDSMNASKPRFAEAAGTRRQQILDAITHAERGSLRGRRYADGMGMMKLEFVDRSRVFMTDPAGQTLAGTYKEERDGRILVTVGANTIVLTREGKHLVGGPVRVRRVEG